MPSLGSFAIYCYSQHSHLYYSNKSVTSQSGVQQRNPLGPLLFSLTLWLIIEETESKIPSLTQHCWYFEDGIIAGTEPELNDTLDILTVSGKTCGLELRRDKCGVWRKRDLNTIDSRIKRNSREGLEIQGAAVRSPWLVSASIQKRIQKIAKFLENLEYINDPLCALGILRSCLGAPKMVYSPRCNTPLEAAINIFEEFDSLQRTTFENILGTVLSNESWHQACLSIKKTGIGIWRASDQIKAAYIGSISQSATLVEHITSLLPKWLMK